jgi:hypothetical protein
LNFFYFEKNCPLKMGSTNFTPLPLEMADPPPLEKNTCTCVIRGHMREKRIFPSLIRTHSAYYNDEDFEVQRVAHKVQGGADAAKRQKLT